MKVETITKEIIDTNGPFYHFLKDKNHYEREYLTCMENTVYHLLDQQTSANKPGMLLGKIQSGKTRTFLGIMGLAYDNGYDLVILLTKGTKVLVQQTISRVKQEFDGMIQRDKMGVYDIMSLPSNLKKWELRKKLTIVVKKETKNMDRLYEALFETYPTLQDKNILFIDDEADFASVSFEKNTKKNITEMSVIASKIDKIRSDIRQGSFLQVTATPYSLYLQPEQYEMDGKIKFQPNRPAFTELVPVHDQYVGGDFYFNESKKENSPAYYLYQEINEKDLSLMKKMDLRHVRLRKDNLLKQKNLLNLNKAIINFIVGSCVRRWQQKTLHLDQEKYSMVIHTERTKPAHEWQQQLIDSIIDDFVHLREEDQAHFNELIEKAYDNLTKSVKLTAMPVPSFDEVLEETEQALQEEMIVVSIVNSDKDVEELLDSSGQLQLRTPMNIFIGGQILDRGVTIGNLTSFFYGRNPKSFQQDTVLQHARMYGARSMEDMAVTRFYTTRKLYNMMESIHEFDTQLRDAFEKGGHDRGIVFIQQDTSQNIKPCNPNKILLSKVVPLQAHKRFLPVGFQTGYKTHIRKTIKEIDHSIDTLKRKSQQTYNDDAFLVPIDEVKRILSKIDETLIMEEGYEWNLEEYFSILDYLVMDHAEKKVWIIARENRNISRIDSEGRFEDAPDTPSGEKSELAVARKVAIDHPALMLLKQNGDKEKGWRGAPFWWPVMLTPFNTISTVYAKETMD